MVLVSKNRNNNWMKVQIKHILTLSLIFMGLSVFSQDGESLEDLFKVDYDTPLTLDLEEEEKENA